MPDLDKLQKKLNYRFKNLELLKTALDRRVYKAVNGKNTRPFESFEFVGDRVLNLCIATIISDLHPEWTPNQLQELYTHYTRNTNSEARHGGPLYRIAKELDIESNLTGIEDEVLDKAGKRGRATKKRIKTKEGILSDHMEALFKAIYKDSAYNLQVVIPIVENLFRPLGLLDADHISVSNFGESHSSHNEEDDDDEKNTKNENFIKWVSTGNLFELKKPEYASISAKKATYGLLMALTNKHNHIVPHLAKQYTIDLEIVRDELDNPELDVSTRGFLKHFLVKQLLEKNKANLLSDTEKEDLFILLISQGNIAVLKEVKLKVTSSKIDEGFALAVRDNKADIIVLLVKEYAIKVDIIREAITKIPADWNVKKFLEKRLKTMENNVSPISMVILSPNSEKNILSEDFKENEEAINSDMSDSPIYSSNKEDLKQVGIFGEQARRNTEIKKSVVLEINTNIEDNANKVGCYCIIQ